ncbi:MAG: MoaD/ThiS family protein [Chloroflexi bacterium]|nr:MAG: MoaD/ThiS family protein [Chloroflexota bacterium]HDN81055.1 MoaD/ThiS family protein [Chloroflexota bacterium]
MQVTVRVYASLRRHLPEKYSSNPIELELPEGTTVGEMIEKVLKLPHDSVKVVFVNGKHSDFDQLLSDGDRVGVFPPVAGG